MHVIANTVRLITELIGIKNTVVQITRLKLYFGMYIPTMYIISVGIQHITFDKVITTSCVIHLLSEEDFDFNPLNFFLKIIT